MGQRERRGMKAVEVQNSVLNKERFERLFLSPIPLEDLKELMREVFREMLPSMKTEVVTSDDDVLDNKELSREFHISIPTIWKYRRKGIIPYFTIGNRVRFRRNEVKKALEKLYKE